MADRIWAQRFWNRDNKPAWHHKGFNFLQPMSVEGALDAMKADYTVIKVPLFAAGGRGIGNIKTDYSIIVRLETADEDEKRVFGSPVSNSYELIGPRSFCRTLDAAVGNVDYLEQPALAVETLGVLGHGEEIFASFKLDAFDVKGDPIEMYMVVYSPMYSGKAAVIVTSGVRPICSNTLALSLKAAIQRMHIVHLPGAEKRMKDTLNQMYQQSKANVSEAKEAFERLSAKKLTDDKAKIAIQWIYPDPQKPQPGWDFKFGVPLSVHQERYEQKLAIVDDIRSTVFGLYSGDGVGMDSPSVKGNAFGVYNAVSEYETFRRDGSFDRTMVAMVVGDRASRISKAFNVMDRFNPLHPMALDPERVSVKS